MRSGKRIIGGYGRESSVGSPTRRRFMARGVVDEILAPTFLEAVVDGRRPTRPKGCEVAAAAQKTLAVPHGTPRITRHWGGGGAGTVSHAKQQMQLLLEEFADSLDFGEACYWSSSCNLGGWGTFVHCEHKLACFYKPRPRACA